MTTNSPKTKRPKLTDDDRTVIDDVLDYLCEGRVEHDSEFERLVDRPIILSRKLAEFG